LSAGDARCIEVNWDLIRLQFVVSTIAIREYTWDIVSLNNIKKTFSRESSNSSRDAIGRDDVDPYDLLCYLYSSLDLFFMMTMSTTEATLLRKRE
jgi:hypothetical protein